MSGPRLSVRTLMVLIAVIALAFGSVGLVRRRAISLREAPKHQRMVDYWLAERQQFGEVLARSKGGGPFLFHGVGYDSPERWESDIREVVAYHGRMRRGHERTARRPWEAPPAEARPALSLVVPLPPY